jgi:CheY-like chemotaxis protein
MIVPGKILVIDDVRKDVKNLLTSLESMGEYVVFQTSMPSDEQILTNVRLLITDLYLIPNDRYQSIELIVGILDKLDVQTKFFLVAIWSKFIDGEKGDDVIEELKSKFKLRTNRDLNAVFLEPLGDPKKLYHKTLVQRINSFINSQPELGLVYELERILENGRDKVVSDIAQAGNFGVIAHSLEKQLGEEALKRCIMQLFCKILNRHVKATETLGSCIKSLLKTTPRFSPEGFAEIYNLQAYYYVDDREPFWTGDVLAKDSGANKEFKVVVSPTCDFAQKKLKFMILVCSTRIDHTSLSQKNKIEEIRKDLGLKIEKSQLVHAILGGTAKLPRKYHVLKFLKEKDTSDFFHLVLDFERIENLAYGTTTELSERGWKRICRIDDPWISDIQQKFSTHSSRIGVFEVPNDIIKKIHERIV